MSAIQNGLANHPESKLLGEASTQLFSLRNGAEVWGKLMELAQSFVAADGYATWVQRPKGYWSTLETRGLSAEFIDKSSFLADAPSLPWDAHLIPDIALNSSIAARAPLFRKEGLQSILIIPLRVRGEETGAIVFYSRTASTFTSEEVHRATILGYLGGAALTTAFSSERRRVEFDLITDTVPALICSLNARREIRRVNKSFADFFGVTEAQALGRALERVTGLAADELTPALDEAYSGQLCTKRLRAVRQDGVTRDLEFQFTPRVDPGRGVLGMVALALDVTEKIKAHETQERLAALVDSSDDAIVSKTLEGVVQTWNKGAELIFGYTAAEAIGKNIRLIVPAERLQEEDEVLSRIARGDKVDHFRTQRRHKLGHLLDISLTVSPIRGEDGTIIGASKIARDITAQVRSEQHREQLLEDVQRSNQDLRQFAHSASHDLKEPLRMVTIYSELLRAQFGGPLGEKGGLYLNQIHGGALRMEGLVQGLFHYTEASLAELEDLPVVDLNDGLNEALENLALQRQASGAQITSMQLPCARMLHIHVVQLFQNLIGNAIKYRRPGEPAVINICFEKRGAEWLFAVRDNGIGIDPRFKEQVFGLFKRLHTNDRYTGSGIGLAICHRIVQRSGGRIWVESELGSGSTFFFTLPTPE